MSLYVQSSVSGLLTAGTLTLMALGFSLLWHSLKVVNLAHFSLVLLAAYVTYSFSTATGLGPFVALVVCVPLFAGIAMAVQWLFDTFEVPAANTLLLTFALFIAFEGAISNVWGADFVRIDSSINPYAVKSWTVAGIPVPVAQLIAFLVAAPVAAFGARFLRRSYVGKALRAIAQDRDIAVAYGVNYRRVATLLAGVAGATAAIAGVLVATGSVLFPSASHAWIGMVFAVTILGGIGSPLGLLVAAMLVGVINGVGTVAVGASEAQLLTFLLLVVVLLVRPDGLFKRARA